LRNSPRPFANTSLGKRAVGERGIRLGQSVEKWPPGLATCRPRDEPSFRHRRASAEFFAIFLVAAVVFVAGPN
jgi:hypothetical protein